jgi:repressor LexA
MIGTLAMPKSNDMPARMPAATRPTKRQTEYLAFIRAFTERWGIPPSFEEIGKHFGVTTPSVNTMVKALEARAFLTRVPGQARTLRVIVPDAWCAPAEPKSPAAAAFAHASLNTGARIAAHMADLIIERLVPALRGASEEHHGRALDAISQALEIACIEAGSSVDEHRELQDHLRRVAMIARGMSLETRPGRKLPWWRRPKRAIAGSRAPR